MGAISAPTSFSGREEDCSSTSRTSVLGCVHGGYAMVVDDGPISTIVIEPDFGGDNDLVDPFDVGAADTMLADPKARSPAGQAGAEARP